MKTSALSEFDLYLFHQGTNYHAQEMLGAHFVEQDGKKGVGLRYGRRMRRQSASWVSSTTGMCSSIR